MQFLHGAEFPVPPLTPHQQFLSDCTSKSNATWIKGEGLLLLLQVMIIGKSDGCKDKQG